MRDSDPLTAYRYHGSRFQGMSMPFEDFGRQCDASFGRDVRQPDQSGVRLVVHVDQLAKVGVYRNQYAVRR